MALITVVIILMVIILMLVWHIISIKQEIRSIIKQLESIETVSDENNHCLRINHSNRDLEKLAEMFNQKMKTDLKLKVQLDYQYNQMLQMVSGLAHDFRTPITVILGYLELMEKDGAENKEYMAAIKNRTIQLNSSVNRLYDYFRIGNSRTIQNQLLDLKLFIPKMLGDLYQIISEYGVDVDLETKCTNCTIVADEEMLSRVMENLLINAAKYNTRKTIAIKICLGENNYLDLSISNSCTPFYDDDLERIFDLFYRKDTSRHDGSSGIGLSIVKVFVEKMHGKVVAEYIDKKFVITLSFLQYKTSIFDVAEKNSVFK